MPSIYSSYLTEILYSLTNISKISLPYYWWNITNSKNKTFKIKHSNSTKTLSPPWILVPQLAHWGTNFSQFPADPSRDLLCKNQYIKAYPRLLFCTNGHEEQSLPVSSLFSLRCCSVTIWGSASFTGHMVSYERAGFGQRATCVSLCWRLCWMLEVRVSNTLESIWVFTFSVDWDSLCAILYLWDPSKGSALCRVLSCHLSRNCDLCISWWPTFTEQLIHVRLFKELYINRLSLHNHPQGGRCYGTSILQMRTLRPALEKWHTG